MTSNKLQSELDLFFKIHFGAAAALAFLAATAFEDSKQSRIVAENPSVLIFLPLAIMGAVILAYIYTFTGSYYIYEARNQVGEQEGQDPPIFVRALELFYAFCIAILGIVTARAAEFAFADLKYGHWNLTGVGGAIALTLGVRIWTLALLSMKHGGVAFVEKHGLFLPRLWARELWKALERSYRRDSIPSAAVGTVSEGPTARDKP